MANGDAERRAFKEKLRSLSFGIVPGGYRDTNSTSMYDRESLMSQLSGADGEPIFSKERVEDNRSDFKKAYRDFTSA